jgi:hypothetical protein
MQCITQIFITPRPLKIYKRNQLNKTPSNLTLTLLPRPLHNKITKFRLDIQTVLTEMGGTQKATLCMKEGSHHANQDCVLIHLFSETHGSNKK